nr:tRNA:m(4)X modification enzyme TRM13 homolog isoform X1 [Megalopta genalis]
MGKENHCMYFVTRKKRYCRMTVKKGNRYCGEHQQDSVDDSVDDVAAKRVKCPLDPTHTCYESRLSKHLKVCNAKRLIDSQPSFIVKGINVDGTYETLKHVPLSELNQLVVDTVIDKVKAAHDKLPCFPEVVLQHEVLQSKINDESCGKAVKKHLSQTASLLSHLERAGLVQDNTCFIEFGAGKGKLTYWLGQMIKDRKDSCILLVDRSSHRHKSDNKLKNEQYPLVIKRIRADIADLKLNNIAEIKTFNYKVGIAKHLCGVATDLTINCLNRAMQDKPICNVNGIVIAFCCHHRCEFASYVGKHYLEQCGFTSSEFPILCSIASWATCGSISSRLHADSDKEHNLKVTRYTKSLTSSERETIGRKVKTLLNWGRLEFLNSIGFECKLVYYTTTNVSLENMCIIATKKQI